MIFQIVVVVVVVVVGLVIVQCNSSYKLLLLNYKLINCTAKCAQIASKTRRKKRKENEKNIH